MGAAILRTWDTPPPTTCNVCSALIVDTFSDMRTPNGKWGCVCPKCVDKHHLRYGVGNGQKYERRIIEGKVKWVKTKG